MSNTQTANPQPLQKSASNTVGWWGGGGCTPKNLGLGGMCGPVLQILTLFHTKRCHFPHPFSDLTSKIHTSFQTWRRSQNATYMFTKTEIRSSLLGYWSHLGYALRWQRDAVSEFFFLPVITWLCSRVMRFQSRPTNWPLLTIESPVAQVVRASD